MRLTKLKHACFYIENHDKRLLVDPGNFTTDLDTSLLFDYVVITHEHPDHLGSDKLKRIALSNPNAQFIAHRDTAIDPSLSHRPVLPGEEIKAGPFNLRFFGGDHAPIHPDITTPPNIGVLINQSVYYPGDSLVRPGVPVDYLALPISAPWLKISESIDLLRDVNPRHAFPTHDAILSDSGKTLVDNLVTRLSGGINYRRINGSIDI